MRTFKIREIRNLIPFFFRFPGQQRWYKWNIGISEIIPELTINFLPERKRKGFIPFLSLFLFNSSIKRHQFRRQKGSKGITGRLIGSRPSLADFLPSSARPRRINFRVGRRFYGGSRTRNYRKEEDSREKEEEKLLCRCPAFLIHLSLLEKGRIHPPPLPPLLKRVYTHLLASSLQIESTFIQSSPPRWRRKRQRVGNERLRSYDRSD